MTTTKCDNCNGEGIVGQGESPWLKQGHLEVCKKCTGTGKIEVPDEDETPVETPSNEDGLKEPDTTDQTDGGEKKEADTAPVDQDVSPVATDYFVMSASGHFYALKNKIEGTQDLKFYKLSDDGLAEDGTTNEAVLAALVNRLAILNEKFPSEFNDDAILHLQAAIGFLEARTADRVARGVEGKQEA